MTNFNDYTKFELIDLTYDKYTKIFPTLKTFTNNFNNLNQLYVNLLFEFSYSLEMMYQDNDEDLYSGGEIDDNDIVKSLDKCITATTRFIHFLKINDLLESEEYEYYNLQEILDMLKLNYYRLYDED